jgi:hypothetical protein
MVNIYLRAIPSGDIERLSVRPVKWLRFVTFTICGVRGHLSESAMLNGTPVDYDGISLDNIAEAYHYIPEGNIWLIVNILVYAPIGDYHLIELQNNERSNDLLSKRHALHVSAVMSWRAMALCVSSQGPIPMIAMQHTYSPKARVFFC